MLQKNDEIDQSEKSPKKNGINNFLIPNFCKYFLNTNTFLIKSLSVTLFVTFSCFYSPINAAHTHVKPELWKGARGISKISPQITLIENSEVGPAIQATAVDKGIYQGMEFTLPKTIDLSKIGAISFDFKQNMHPGKGSSCALHIRYKNKRIGIRNHFTYGKSEWNHVTMTLDLRTWSALGGKGDAVYGQAAKLTWIPWREMKTPGHSIAVANVKFHPKTINAAAIHGITYRYLVKPNSGDSTGTALTDGRIEKNNQAHYIQYSDMPDIIFDLGGIYKVDELQLAAIAVPTQNISDVNIFTSYDGKEFFMAANIKNKNNDTAKKSYTIGAKKLNLIGRYIRIQLNRARTDFLLNLAEVSFKGALATAADIKKAAKRNYKLGPTLAKINKKNYWQLTDGQNSIQFNKTNGVAVCLKRAGKVIAERIFNRYELSDGHRNVTADAYGDIVISGKAEKNKILFVTTNKSLPGLKFIQKFWWENGQLVQRLTCQSTRTDKNILLTAREVVLNQNFRTGGHYETWGAGHYMTHKYADELAVALPADSAPVVVFDAPSRKQAILHYRYRYNDRFVRIGAGEITSGLIGEKRTIFTATGWILGDGIFLLNKINTVGSQESRFSLVSGDLTEAYDSYLALDEVKKFRASIKRPEWLKNLRLFSSKSWAGYFGLNGLERAKYVNSIIREGVFVHLCSDGNFTWGDFPTQGDIRNLFGARMNSSKCRERHLLTRKVAPKSKLTQYTWCWSASVKSDVFKKHPEWFITHNAKGQELSFFPHFRANPSRLVGIPESAENLVKNIVNFNTFFDNDLWYIDGGGSPVNIDWKNLRFDSPDAWDNVYSEIRKRMIAIKPDFGMFSNNPENPLFDMGFLENSGGAMANWRESAIWMYKFKLWQRADRYYVPIFIYWNWGVLESVHRYVIGTGLAVSPRFYTITDSYYMSAQQQTRYARLVNAQVVPNWRLDNKEVVELIPLTFGSYGWIFICNNDKKKAITRQISTNSSAIGVSDQGKPVYHWCFTAKPFAKFKGYAGEPEREKIYKTYRWQSDFVVTNRFIGKTSWKKRFKQKFNIDANGLQLWLMSQVPAFVYSVNDMRNQMWLPTTLGVKVDGEETTNGMTLKVDCQKRNAEIAALVPPEMIVKSATSNGKALKTHTIFTADTVLTIFKVAQGRSTVELKFAPGKRTGSVTLNVKTAKPGKTMKLTLNSKPVGKLAWQLESDGDLVWSINSSAQTQNIPLPKALRGGLYTVKVFGMDGRLLAQQKFKLANGTFQAPPNTYANYKEKLEIKRIDCKADLPKRNIKVTGGAYRVQHTNCKVMLDANNASIKISSLPMYGSIYNVSAGALEMNLKRFVKLELSSNFAWFAKNGPYPERRVVSIAETEKNTAIGLNIDFATSQGYTKRTFAGTGIAHGERKSPLPNSWGTGKVADNIFSVATKIVSQNSKETLWIDLYQLGVPKDWNNKVMFGLLLQNIAPDRYLQVKVLKSRDNLPAGVKCAKVYSLKRGKLPKVKKIKLSKGKVKIDGNIDPVEWKKAVVLTKFHNMKDISSSCKPTEFKLLSDKNYLYVAGIFHDNKTNGFDVSGIAPWNKDSAELYFRAQVNQKDYFQFIFDASGNYYAKWRSKPGPGVTRDLHRPLYKVLLKDKNTMVFEAALPRSLWENSKKVRFNLGRNRVYKGLIQHYTLAEGKKFTNFDMFEIVF